MAAIWSGTGRLAMQAVYGVESIFVNLTNFNIGVYSIRPLLTKFNIWARGRGWGGGNLPSSRRFTKKCKPAAGRKC